MFTERASDWTLSMEIPHHLVVLSLSFTLWIDNVNWNSCIRRLKNFPPFLKWLREIKAPLRLFKRSRMPDLCGRPSRTGYRWPGRVRTPSDCTQRDFCQSKLTRWLIVSLQGGMHKQTLNIPALHCSTVHVRFLRSNPTLSLLKRDSQPVGSRNLKSSRKEVFVRIRKVGLPPISVTRVGILDPASYEGWVCCWF